MISTDANLLYNIVICTELVITVDESE
jgi:hypothetical protein